MGVNKGQIGGIFGALGLLMLIMAFFINNLSGEDTNQQSTKCTWNKIEICDPDCNESSFAEGCETLDDVCHTRDAGIVYLIFLLLATIFSLIGVLAVFIQFINNKLEQHIRFLFLICSICCIIAITTWIGVGTSSKICLNPDWDHPYLGGSMILPIISVIVFLSATCLVWKQHETENGYETLL